MGTVWKLAGVFLLICSSTPFASAGDACPWRARMANFCTCKHDMILNKSSSLRAVAPTTSSRVRDPYLHTIVECDFEGNSRSSLEEVATGLHRKWVDRLVVSNVPFAKEMTVVTLPSRWLKDIRVKQFEITKTVLSGEFIWNGKPFENQDESLNWLAAIDCSLTGALTDDTLGTVHTKGLDGLPRLEGLDLSENRLVTVSNWAFRSNKHPRLATVILSRNVIEKVQDNAFAELKKLRHLDLSHNLLESFNRKMFEPNPKSLRRINISWNRLKSLEENIFHNMPSLKIVDVSKNFLYSMPEKPWDSVWWKLEYVNLLGNFVECNCDLEWMFPNTTTAPIVRKRRIIRGQCARTLPSLLVRHFDLKKLKRNDLMCGNEEGYDYSIEEEDEKDKDWEYTPTNFPLWTWPDV